jgi:hypothetical protein
VRNINPLGARAASPLLYLKDPWGSFIAYVFRLNFVLGDPEKPGTVNRCPTTIRAANQRFDIDDVMND